MKFALVDRIIDLEKDSKIVAVKNLSLAEEYLQDHFPGFPVMPGVLILESIVQAGAWLLRYSNDFAYSTTLLKQAKAVRYKSFVSPGDTLRIECQIKSNEGNIYEIKGTGFVGETNVCNAKLYLEQRNLVESCESMQQSDEDLIKHLKQMFNTLWKT